MALQSIPVIIAGIDAGLNLFSTGKQYFGDNTDYKVLTQLKNIEKAILGIDLDRSLKRISKELQDEYGEIITDKNSTKEKLLQKQDSLERLIAGYNFIIKNFKDDKSNYKTLIDENTKKLNKVNTQIGNINKDLQYSNSQLKILKSQENGNQPLRTLDNSLKEVLTRLSSSIDVLNSKLHNKTNMTKGLINIPANTNTEKIKPFADGGIVTKPTFSLVGEAGAEAVIPLKHGSVPVSLNTPFQSMEY